MLGWYWIPGNAWGPAWVNWAYGGDYIGWCPLGLHDRPVLYGGRRADSGRAVPRGVSNPFGSGESWAYVRRADFSASDLMQRIQPTPPAGHEVHAVEHVQAPPGRDLASPRIAAGTAVAPRNAKTRFGAGDATPALRADPAATSRFRAARRSPRHTEEEAPAAPQDPAPAPGVHTRPAHPVRVTPEAAPQARPQEARPMDQDHEVLRRVFGPLSQPRPAEGPARPVTPPSSSVHDQAARPSPGASARPEAPRVQPGSTPSAHGDRRQPKPASSAQATGRKDKDH
jgi:hypothetical protein